jgi:hypothetical protein
MLNKAEEAVTDILKAFENTHDLPKPLAQVFVNRKDGTPCRGWSWRNQLIAALRGHEDRELSEKWQTFVYERNSIMANGCRSIVRVLGPEPDVVRFAAYVARQEDDQEEDQDEEDEQDEDDKHESLLHIAEFCDLERTSGSAKYEVLTHWSPPLDALTDTSRQFPTLTLEVEWEEPGMDLLGCAVISDGNRSVLTLDHLLEYAKERFREVHRERFQDEWEDEGDADVALSWEILREATRRYFGGQQDEQEEGDDLWTVAKVFARQVVEESDSRLPFTGGGIVTETFDEWEERSAWFPGDRDLIAQGEEPVLNGEDEELLNELLGDVLPDAQGSEQSNWQNEGF